MKHFLPTLSKPIKSTMWICVNFNHKMQHPRIYTLKANRSESINSLTNDTSYTWDDLKKFGWRCIKVKMTLVQ